MVQEQRGFALNRLGRRDEAEFALKQIIADFGPSSETNSLLGRVYKDRWEDARKANDQLRARGELETRHRRLSRGIFEAGLARPLPWHQCRHTDGIPGQGRPASGPKFCLSYSMPQRSAAKCPNADYWTFATLIEVAILSRNDEAAWEALENALLPLVRESWVEPGKTTRRNLRFIREHRHERGETVRHDRGDRGGKTRQGDTRLFGDRGLQSAGPPSSRAL